MRANENKPYRAHFRINYNLVKSFEKTEILDSGLFEFEDLENLPPNKSIEGSFLLDVRKLQGGNVHLLRLTMTDVNRKVDFENFIYLDRTSPVTEQNFVMTDTANHLIFKNHVPVNVPFKLRHNSGFQGKYWVSWYNRKFPLALPPYSSSKNNSFTLEPDSTFQIDAGQIIEFSERGFYHFRLDTNTWSGYTVYSFYDQFPFITKRLHLGPPLRYLTTKREYKEISEAMHDPVKMKESVDNFWLGRSGSLERSKVLVQSFYSRVEDANIHFSSYLEGWKTDRGIIYVIYGPPNKVYRSTTGEAWVYGDETSSLSYYFNFLRVSNPFTANDYSLERMGSYRYGWGQAIESWRNGHIYNSKDIKREQDESDQIRYRQRPPYWY